MGEARERATVRCEALHDAAVTHLVRVRVRIKGRGRGLEVGVGVGVGPRPTE